MDKKWHIYAYKDKCSKRILTLCNNEAVANNFRGISLPTDTKIYVDGTMALDELFLKRASSYWAIHAVKRHTDGEVFAVGDVLIHPTNKNKVTITKILHPPVPTQESRNGFKDIVTPIIYMSNSGFIYGYTGGSGYFWDVKKFKE